MSYDVDDAHVISAANSRLCYAALLFAQTCYPEDVNDRLGHAETLRMYQWAIEAARKDANV